MRNISLLFFLTILSLFFSLPAPAPASASDARGQDSYHEWLKRYGALDIYAMRVKDDEAGPAGQLDYADALISLDNPEEALSFLRTVRTGDVPELEGRKHWIRHRALRKLGRFDEAVLAVIETSGYLGAEETSRLMNNEPGLDILWSNVWKTWFFYSLSPEFIKEGRRMIMDQSVLLARAAWPDRNLWETVDIPLSIYTPAASRPTTDHIQAARALALWSIANWELADRALARMENPDIRSFLENFGRFLESSDLNSWQSNLKTLKSAGFADVYATHLHEFGLQHFMLSSPMVGSWEPFLERIRGLDPKSALDLIQQELASALLSDEVRGKLEALAFIYELQDGPYRLALDSWREAMNNSPDLPYTLYLAVSLLKQDLRPLDGLPASRYPFLREVLNAAGLNRDSRYLADFWKHEQQEIGRLYALYPLDYSVNFLYFNKSFQADQNQAAARNMAFLFPHSEPGQSAYLTMAQHAYKDGNKALAWRYLQNISEEFAQGPRQLDLLEAKAGILMDMGREEESLSTYQVILKKSPQRISPERRLRLALLAQEKNRWHLAQDMLEALWEDRSALPDPVKAEVLFWLGEGAQHQGDMDVALDYYLRLSWQFPEQNIWAVTAMYRAGLIYEQRGIMDTARNLFQTVMRNADTKGQKEAARQRLDAIESRMGASERDAFLF